MKLLNAAQIWIACHGIHSETHRSSLTSDADLIAFAQAEPWLTRIFIVDNFLLRVIVPLIPIYAVILKREKL